MPQPDEPTAEAARELLEAMDADVGEYPPPSTEQFIGEFCSEHACSKVEARAALYRAVRRGFADVEWLSGHPRVVLQPPTEDEAA